MDNILGTGKWLIYGTQHRKDNQSQAWNAPVYYSG